MIRIADVNVEIDTLSENMMRYSRDYLVSGQKPDISVRIRQEDLDEEWKIIQEDAKRFHVQPVIHSAAESEWICIYEKICEQLVDYNVLMYHGSCLSMDGKGYLFTAMSGTGKSTHARMWRETFGDRVVMINDDKPLVRVGEDGSVFAYGTPWCGKHHLNTNTSVPLRAIISLNRGTTNRIEKIPRKEAYSHLLRKGIFYPKESEKRLKVAKLLDMMNQHLDYYECWCDISHEAARVIYQGLTKSETEEK
jgi:hypothetical protein